jgi:hypothetical protein
MRVRVLIEFGVRPKSTAIDLFLKSGDVDRIRCVNSVNVNIISKGLSPSAVAPRAIAKRRFIIKNG